MPDILDNLFASYIDLLRTADSDQEVVRLAGHFHYKRWSNPGSIFFFDGWRTFREQVFRLQAGELSQSRNHAQWIAFDLALEDVARAGGPATSRTEGRQFIQAMMEVLTEIFLPEQFKRTWPGLGVEGATRHASYLLNNYHQYGLFIRTTSKVKEFSIPSFNPISVAMDEAIERFLAPQTPGDVFTRANAGGLGTTNVLGVGFGPSRIDRGLGKAAALRLYVESSANEGGLPHEINGIPTEVIVTGRFMAAPSQAKGRVHRSRRRPARPGQSVGFFKAGHLMAGTFGALVQVGRRTHLLSNNHVLADCDRLKPGVPIFQPGLLDGGVNPADRIATLSHVEPLVMSGAGDMDAALASVDDTRDVFPEFLRPVGWLKSPIPVPVRRGMVVEKVGRNGYTRGVLFDEKVTLRVQYPGLGSLLFRDQCLIQGGTVARPFAKGGDSGAVVIEPGRKRAVGLLFAASPTFAVITPLHSVLAKLGATLRIR